MITREEFEGYCIKNGLRYRCNNAVWNDLLDRDWNKNIFSYLCIFGYIETAKWYHSLGGVDIHIENDFAFRLSCGNGHHKKFTS